jgi:hypothetical protein
VLDEGPRLPPLPKLEPPPVRPPLLDGLTVELLPDRLGLLGDALFPPGLLNVLLPPPGRPPPLLLDEPEFPFERLPPNVELLPECVLPPPDPLDDPPLDRGWDGAALLGAGAEWLDPDE